MGLALAALVSACLNLDLGTIFSLKRMDPYAIDLVNSRAAVFLPADLEPGEHVNVTIKIKQAGRFLAEEKFALEVVGEGEDLSGIKLPSVPGRPYVIRLAAKDAARAVDLQTRLGKLDKNHKWIEPEEDTVGTVQEEAPQSDGVDWPSNADEPVNGDVSLSWDVKPTAEARDRVCAKPKKYKFWAWVKVNDYPAFRRVVHGLSLKRLFGKEGVASMCEIDAAAEADIAA